MTGAAPRGTVLGYRRSDGRVGIRDVVVVVYLVECARLVALGASRLRRFDPDPPMSHGYIVMRDPEDNEFCLD